MLGSTADLQLWLTAPHTLPKEWDLFLGPPSIG